MYFMIRTFFFGAHPAATLNADGRAIEAPQEQVVLDTAQPTDVQMASHAKTPVQKIIMPKQHWPVSSV